MLKKILKKTVLKTIAVVMIAILSYYLLLFLLADGGKVLVIGLWIISALPILIGSVLLAYVGWKMYIAKDTPTLAPKVDVGRFTYGRREEDERGNVGSIMSDSVAKDRRNNHIHQ